METLTHPASLLIEWIDERNSFHTLSSSRLDFSVNAHVRASRTRSMLAAQRRTEALEGQLKALGFTIDQLVEFVPLRDQLFEFGIPTQLLARPAGRVKATGEWRFTQFADSDTFGSKIVSGATMADAYTALQASIAAGTTFRKVV